MEIKDNCDNLYDSSRNSLMDNCKNYKPINAIIHKKIKIIQTKTYIKSLDKLKDLRMRVAVEKKVNSLLINQDIAKPMSYQHEGFCEIKIGGKYRLYCIKIENAIVIAFILGPVVDHDDNYKNSKEYQILFAKLREVKEEFKNKI